MPSKQLKTRNKHFTHDDNPLDCRRGWIGRLDWPAGLADVKVGQCLLKDDSTRWNTSFWKNRPLGRCGVVAFHLPTSLFGLNSRNDDNNTSFTDVATVMWPHNWFRDSRTSAPTVFVLIICQTFASDRARRYSLTPSLGGGVISCEYRHKWYRPSLPLKTRFFGLHFTRRMYRCVLNHFYVIRKKAT